MNQRVSALTRAPERRIARQSDSVLTRTVRSSGSTRTPLIPLTNDTRGSGSSGASLSDSAEAQPAKSTSRHPESTLDRSPPPWSPTPLPRLLRIPVRTFAACERHCEAPTLGVLPRHNQSEDHSMPLLSAKKMVPLSRPVTRWLALAQTTSARPPLRLPLRPSLFPTQTSQ